MTKNEIKYFSKLKQKKYRDSESKFLIEGEHLIDECIKSEFYKENLLNVFVRNDFTNNDLINRIQINTPLIEIFYLNTKSFSALSDTVNSQGIIGVVSKAFGDSTLPSGKLLVALDKLSDPGNLGTIMRICYWFGVDRLLLSKESAEIYNPKVIRSSQGAIFSLNIIDGLNLEEELVKLHEDGINVILSDLQSNIYLSDYEVTPEKNYVLVFGNESSGISKKITANKNYTNLKIKGFTSCESLNVSVSAGIVLNYFKTKLQ